MLTRKRHSICKAALHAQHWIQPGQHIRLRKEAGEASVPAEAQQILLCVNGFLPRRGLPSGVLDVPTACTDVMQGPHKIQSCVGDESVAQ